MPERGRTDSTLGARAICVKNVARGSLPATRPPPQEEMRTTPCNGWVRRCPSFAEAARQQPPAVLSSQFSVKRAERELRRNAERLVDLPEQASRLLDLLVHVIDEPVKAVRLPAELG